MTLYLACTFLLLSLVQHSQSTPPECEELLRPFDHILPQDLEGKWALVATGLNGTSASESFKQRDSAIVNFVSINGTNMFFTRVFGFNESCQYYRAEITLGGSGFFFSQFNLTVIFMHTSCPDCLVMHFDNQAKTPMPLYLFSRGREVEQSEMEEFKAQVECMKMSHVVVMEPSKKLCPEQSPDITTPAPVHKKAA